MNQGMSAELVRPNDPRLGAAWTERDLAYEQSLVAEAEPLFVIVGAHVSDDRIAAAKWLGRVGATPADVRRFRDAGRLGSH